MVDTLPSLDYYRISNSIPLRWTRNVKAQKDDKEPINPIITPPLVSRDVFFPAADNLNVCDMYPGKLQQFILGVARFLLIWCSYLTLECVPPSKLFSTSAFRLIKTKMFMLWQRHTALVNEVRFTYLLSCEVFCHNINFSDLSLPVINYSHIWGLLGPF